MSDDRAISEMRNLGPAIERDLAAVGIIVAQQVIDLGAEETFLRMLLGRKKEGRSGNACNAAYLYALYGAIHDVDWLEVPEVVKDGFKKFTADLRESGQFK
ncbi:TfoX/Sxy family DNA transformation protein [Mariniblastus fucicola]|uniref:TfoX C-terminal domain-containing protein n=1 Tax=Mariniblastus fucicola TaxID=980251 RepID=A0A5B9P9N5_9BACT|nr:TfoX/Sxy family DNA transformation protein [Mariniblastus fucicola]QEG23467.1 hypothetical protein MFFC18_33660 [Mariniblastus fucicola]